MNLKQLAIQLRKEGWSYNVISDKLGLGKSTLSHWLAEIPYAPNKETLRRIKAGPAKSARLNHEKKLAAIQSAKTQAAQEFGELTRRDLWMLGLGLYIGEGSKAYEYTRIVNSDPEVIQLAMRWFREICGVPSDNFLLRVHLYPNVPVSEAIEFWSKITGIPKNQFGKTQIDKRLDKSQKKQGRLPFGTIHISIRSCGNPKFGVSLHRKIMGWIKAGYNQERGYGLVVKHLPSKEKSRVRFPLPAPEKQQALF